MILCSSYCCSTVGWLYIWIGTKHLHIQALQFRTKTRREKSESFWESPIRNRTTRVYCCLLLGRPIGYSLSNTHFFYFKIFFYTFQIQTKNTGRNVIHLDLGNYRELQNNVFQNAKEKGRYITFALHFFLFKKENDLR